MKPVGGSAAIADALVVVLLAVSAPAVAQEPARVTERPAVGWTRAPGFADVAAAYPTSGAGATGLVIFGCRVSAEGGLEACAVTHEEPVGRGFAAAARGLLPDFGADVAPLPVRGSNFVVRVAIRLPPPDSPQIRDRRIDAPIWLASPDERTILALFPAQARESGLTSGRATIRCRIGAGGWLADCAAVSSDPEGMGFSEAALKMAPMMRMSLWTAAGGPTDAPIDLPIRFQLAPEAQGLSSEQVPTLDQKVDIIPMPHWIRRPTGQEIGDVFPEAAARHGVSGRVVMLCQVLPTGHTGACKIEQETPPGWGFGLASLRLARSFLMVSPKVEPGAPTPYVEIPIGFQMGRR